MVSKFPQVELQLSANVANINEPVELTANLSDLELEQIEDQGGEIWFVVDDDEMSAGDTSPPTVTWKSGKPGEYRAKVELRLPGRKPDRLGHARIHVVRGLEALTLELGPPVAEGTTIENLKPSGGVLTPHDADGSRASLRVGYGSSRHRRGTNGRKPPHHNQLEHDRHQPRHAQRHGPAGRRARPSRHEQGNPHDGDRHDPDHAR